MEKKVHYVPCYCSGDDCECSAYCRIASDEYESTGRAIYVTCKRCLSAMAARNKRVAEGKQDEWIY